MTAADLTHVRDAIAAHKGKVVLLDFWATWCRPCVATFPRLIKWQQDHGASGLAVVSVSLDALEEKETGVRRFLEQHRPGFETLILDVPNYNEFVQSMSDQWSGAIPALFVFDRSGKLRHVIMGEQPEGAVESRFAPLLEEPVPAGNR